MSYLRSTLITKHLVGARSHKFPVSNPKSDRRTSLIICRLGFRPLPNRSAAPTDRGLKWKNIKIILYNHLTANSACVVRAALLRTGELPLGKLPIAHLGTKICYRLGNSLTQIGIGLSKGGHAIGKAQHVSSNQDLSVAVRTGTNANSGNC